jgi:hypothetical protein
MAKSHLFAAGQLPLPNGAGGLGGNLGFLDEFSCTLDSLDDFDATDGSGGGFDVPGVCCGGLSVPDDGRKPIKSPYHWSSQEDGKLEKLILAALKMKERLACHKQALISPAFAAPKEPERCQLSFHDWRAIACLMGPGRTARQCKNRYEGYIHPKVKAPAWTEREERTLFEAHRAFGPRWAKIADRLPGRSDQEVKHHYNHVVSKEPCKFKRGPVSERRLSFACS